MQCSHDQQSGTRTTRRATDQQNTLAHSEVASPAVAPPERTLIAPASRGAVRSTDCTSRMQDTWRTNRGNGRDDLSKLELVQNGRLTGSVETDLQKGARSSEAGWALECGLRCVRECQRRTMRIRISFLEKRRANSLVNVSPIVPSQPRSARPMELSASRPRARALRDQTSARNVNFGRHGSAERA